MDKYEITFLKTFGYVVSYENNGKKIMSSTLSVDDNGNYIINQAENYRIEDYNLIFIAAEGNKRLINSIVFNGKEYVENEIGNRPDVKLISIPIKYQEKVDTITINFNSVVYDSITSGIEYVDSDKEKWDAKEKAEYNRKLVSSMNIQIKCGLDLVNITFNECCDSVDNTEIILYASSGQMMAKYKVDKGCYFKSINGLAFGSYSVVVKQYDNKNQLLAESDKKGFNLTLPNFGGKPQIVL